MSARCSLDFRTVVWRVSAIMGSSGFALKLTTLISAGVVVWGGVRVVAFSEQQPARAMLLFGGIGLVVSVGVWLEERR